MRTGVRGETFAQWLRAALVMGLMVWMSSYLLPPINLDVACLLYAAQRWLAGDRLYVDVIDPNTPWAIALHVPAEFLARQLGGQGPTWFSLCVLFAIGVSVGLTGLLTRRMRATLGPLVASVLPLLLLFVLGVDAGRCFGQREHLLMVGSAPYLVLSAQRLKSDSAELSPGLRASIALVAGLAFAIKPHFLLPFVFVELSLLVARGPKNVLRDFVPWLIGGVQVAHLLFAVLVTPEYLTVIVPLSAEVYADPDHLMARALAILWGVELAPIVMILPLLATASYQARLLFGLPLTAFVSGAIVMSALQGKGWDYHSLPAVQATLLFMGIFLAHLVQRISRAVVRSPGVSMTLSVALIFPFLFLDALRLAPFRDQLRYPDGPVDDWVEVLEREAGNRRILVLSAGIYPQFPAINYARFQMATPLLTLWPLHDLYESCAPGETGFRALGKQPRPEAYVFEEVVEGLTEEQPEVVVVDEKDIFFDCSRQKFEYLRYFQRDPRFLQEFQNYRPLKTIDRFVFYERVDKRAPDSHKRSPLPIPPRSHGAFGRLLGP